MTEILQAVRGMNDVLPDAAALWERFEDAAREVLAQYGYRNMRVPIVEATPLFVRGIGDATDIVEHEMYTFEDKLNGESLTLRPEATAGIVRAAIEHSLTYERPQRVWTAGRCFPRAPAEAATASSTVDAEALGPAGRTSRPADRMLARLCGARRHGTGCDNRSATYGAAHRAADRHLRAPALDAMRRRLQIRHASSTQEPGCRGDPAGQGSSNASATSRAHFEGSSASSRRAFLPVDGLVRGLDYYNRTVFEFVTDRLGAQGTVAGGGRYDGLFEQLGGKPAPACGFAIGAERLILLLQDSGARTDAVPLAYVVHAGEAASALAWRVAETLRDTGHAAVLNAGGGSFKAQMKRADASGARYALLIGDDEAAAGSVSVKPLRATGEQVTVPLAGLVARLRQDGSVRDS
jgi:histidyl-tRNA synthetase